MFCKICTFCLYFVLFYNTKSILGVESNRQGHFIMSSYLTFAENWICIQINFCFITNVLFLISGRCTFQFFPQINSNCLLLPFPYKYIQLNLSVFPFHWKSGRWEILDKHSNKIKLLQYFETCFRTNRGIVYPSSFKGKSQFYFFDPVHYLERAWLEVTEIFKQSWLIWNICIAITPTKVWVGKQSWFGS